MTPVTDRPAHDGQPWVLTGRHGYAAEADHTGIGGLRPGAPATVAERITGELQEKGDKLMIQDGSVAPIVQGGRGDH